MFIFNNDLTKHAKRRIRTQTTSFHYVARIKHSRRAGIISERGLSLPFNIMLQRLSVNHLSLIGNESESFASCGRRRGAQKTKSATAGRRHHKIRELAHRALSGFSITPRPITVQHCYKAKDSASLKLIGAVVVVVHRWNRPLLLRFGYFRSILPTPRWFAGTFEKAFFPFHLRTLRISYQRSLYTVLCLFALRQLLGQTFLWFRALREVSRVRREIDPRCSVSLHFFLFIATVHHEEPYS